MNWFHYNSKGQKIFACQFSTFTHSMKSIFAFLILYTCENQFHKYVKSNYHLFQVTVVLSGPTSSYCIPSNLKVVEEKLF